MLLAVLSLALPGAAEPDSPQNENVAAMALARDFEKVTGLKDTPASYFIHVLSGEAVTKKVLTLPSNEVYADSVKKFARFSAMIKQGLDWKEPVREIAIPSLKKAPILDGKIDDAEWYRAFEINGEVPLDSGESARAKSTRWKLGWHDEYLYVAADFADRDIHAYTKRRKDSEPLEADAPYLFKGDSLEVFIRPDFNSKFYYELLFNPDGKTWFSSHVNNPRGMRAVIEYDKKMSVKCATSRTEEGFRIEVRIPLRELYGQWSLRSPQAGDVFSIMMVRTDLNNGIYTRSAMVPLLYDGHNIFGYAKAILMKGIKK